MSTPIAGREDGEIVDLALLIEHVAAIPGIDRIRYTTSHPVELSDRLIEVYARVPELVSQLHLPVQSGSDRILALMKRGHTVLEYKAKVRKLRAIRPDLSLSSDFIVGFPGETEQDFAATMTLIDEIISITASASSTAPGPALPPPICRIPRPCRSKRNGWRDYRRGSKNWRMRTVGG
jgi:tRNA-2-methylthio-N6-dimethylallyladenosine synthase